MKMRRRRNFRSNCLYCHCLTVCYLHHLQRMIWRMMKMTRMIAS